jgi:hypothetical protein
MQSDVLTTIEDEALEAVSGGGLLGSIGSTLDKLLSGALHLIGGTLSAIGGVLSGIGGSLG